MTLNLDKSMLKRVSFGDVIENVANRVDDPSAAGVDRYVGLEHLDPGVMTVRRWGTPSDVSAQKLLFEPGDVIFGRRRAYQKKVARADFTGICSAHALVLRARPELIDPYFLPVFLSSDYFLDRAISISVGSLSPTVNWRDLKVQEFDLPPLDDQQRIADLLWAVERERAAVRTLLSEVDASTGAWLNELFGRASGTERSLGEMLDVCQYGLSTRAGETGAYPMLRMTNLDNGEVTDADLKYCDLTANDFENHRLRDGDVLFNRTNSVELVGRSGIFRLDGDFVFASYLVRLRPRPDELIPDYLNEFINSPTGQSRIRVHLSKGVSQANISASKLQTVKIPVLSIDGQRELVERLNALRKRRSAVADRLMSISNLAHQLRVEIFGGVA